MRGVWEENWDSVAGLSQNGVVPMKCSVEPSSALQLGNSIRAGHFSSPLSLLKTKTPHQNNTSSIDSRPFSDHTSYRILCNSHKLSCKSSNLRLLVFTTAQNNLDGAKLDRNQRTATTPDLRLVTSANLASIDQLLRDGVPSCNFRQHHLWHEESSQEERIW